jgi:hypothetical protein
VADIDDILGRAAPLVAGSPDFGEIRRRAHVRRAMRVGIVSVPVVLAGVTFAMVAMVFFRDSDGAPIVAVAAGPGSDATEPALSPGTPPPLPNSAPPVATPTTEAPPPTTAQVEPLGPDQSARPVSDAPGVVGEHGLDSPDPAPAAWRDMGPMIVDTDALPDEGLAVVLDQRVLLLDVDGAILGHVDGVFERGASILVGESGRITLSAAGAAVGVSADPECTPAFHREDVLVELCSRTVPEQGTVYPNRNVSLTTPDGSRIVATTPEGQDWFADPTQPVRGRWEAAELSGDDRWLALQWVGECEMPLTVVVDAETSQLRTLDGRDWLESPPSTFIGWFGDHLLVHVTANRCAAGGKPGLYRYDPEAGSLVLLRSINGPADIRRWEITTAA